MYWPVIFWNVPHLGFLTWFLMIQLKLRIVGKTTTEAVMHLSGCIMSGVHDVCVLSPLTIDLDRLVKVMSASFLYYKVTLVLLVSNRYLGEGTLRWYKFPVALHNFAH